MEFTYHEMFIMMKMVNLLKFPPYSIKEMSRKLGYSQNGHTLWGKPLIKKLVLISALIPFKIEKHFHGQTQYYDIDRNKLDKTILESEHWKTISDFVGRGIIIE